MEAEFTFGEDLSQNYAYLTAISRSQQLDTLEDNYKILTGNSMPDCSSEYVKAFRVESRGKIVDDKYALVFDHRFPAPLDYIAKFRRNHYKHIRSPYNLQIVKLAATSSEHLVVILPIHSEQRLADMEDISEICTEYNVINNFIAPINDLLHSMHNNAMAYGSLNPSNILVSNDKKLYLDECISKIASSQQPALFEPLERCYLWGINKGGANEISDYYAFGMCIAYLIFKGNHSIFKQDSNDERIQENLFYQRVDKGTFQAFFENSKVSPVYRDLLKGLTLDNKEERWGYTEVCEWLKGNKVAIITSNHDLANRPVSFNDKHFINIRYLVEEIQRNWDISMNFLKDNSVVKWLKRNMEFSEPIAEYIDDVIGVKRNSKGLFKMDDEVFIALVLFFLDPDHLVRFRDSRMTLSALPAYIWTSFINNHSSERAHKIIKMLATNFFSAFSEATKFRDLRTGRYPVKLVGDILSRNLEIKTPGFGLEKCLYDLNPFLACQSEALSKYLILNIDDLLMHLEQIALETKEIYLDNHMLSFITSHLEMNDELKLPPFPELKGFKHRNELINLYILSSAQQSSKHSSLPHLTQALKHEFARIVDLFHSKDMTKSMAERLEHVILIGNFNNALKSMLDFKQIKADRDFYYAALAEYWSIEKEIAQFSSKTFLNKLGYEHGLKIAVIISYLLCSAIVIYYMINFL